MPVDLLKSEKLAVTLVQANDLGRGMVSFLYGLADTPRYLPLKCRLDDSVCAFSLLLIARIVVTSVHASLITGGLILKIFDRFNIKKS